MAQLDCKDLSIGYNGKAVLTGINFTVHDGDYLCIFGDNGTGKSTLLKTVLSLQKPLAGHVSFDGMSRKERLPAPTDGYSARLPRLGIRNRAVRMPPRHGAAPFFP